MKIKLKLKEKVMLNRILRLQQDKPRYRKTRSKYVTWNAYYKLKHQIDAMRRNAK